MIYTVTINTDNSAFEDSPAAEIRWILQRLCRELEQTYDPPECKILRDSNGDTVGSATYTEEH